VGFRDPEALRQPPYLVYAVGLQRWLPFARCLGYVARRIPGPVVLPPQCGEGFGQQFHLIVREIGSIDRRGWPAGHAGSLFWPVRQSGTEK